MKEKLLDVINMNPDSSFVVKISNRWELNELLECIKPLDFGGGCSSGRVIGEWL